MTNDIPFLPKHAEVIDIVPCCDASGEPTALWDPRPALTAGDATAWATVVAQYQQLIFSRTRRHGLCPEEAADVSQETWTRLLEHAGDVRDPERLAGWLATTANRECIAVRRRSWREEARPDTSLEGTHEKHGDDGLDDRLDAHHRAQALLAAVAQLPVRDRRLIEMLLEPEPPTYSEISSRLQMPIGSIGPIRARALRRLRRHLRSFAPDEGTSGAETAPRGAGRRDDRPARTRLQAVARSAQPQPSQVTLLAQRKQINGSSEPPRLLEQVDHDRCDAFLAGGPLECVRPQGHPGGHAFHSGRGSWVDDRHGEGGHG
jgi:RNA polymerase sigma factor (sigma-70 family)